jgi:putative transcription factor
MNEIYVVSVEGADLRVCSSCAAGKKLIYKEIEETRTPKVGDKTRKSGDAEKELIEGYGKAMHLARDRMQIPLKVLAEMINEKESHLLKVEEEKTRPSVELTKKIEKALNIKLTAQKSEDGHRGGFGRAEGGATIGDFMSG